MKKSGRAGGHIMGMLRPAKGGVPMAELWTEHCTIQLTGRHLHSKRREGAPLSYRWRPKYCGMDASVISQMHSLEERSCCQADGLRPQDAGVSAQKGARKKRAALHCPSGHAYMSERGPFNVSERCYRYRPRLNDQNKQISNLSVNGLTHGKFSNSTHVSFICKT
jgi:putative transposase